MKYSNRLSGLVSKTENAEHAVPELEQQCTLLRGLPSNLDVNEEATNGSEGDYQHAVAKLLVRIMPHLERDNSTKRLFLSQYRSKEKIPCNKCRKRATLPNIAGKRSTLQTK